MVVALAAVATAPADGEGVGPKLILDESPRTAFRLAQVSTDAPAALNTTAAGFLTDPAGGELTVSSGVFSLGDIGYYSLASVAGAANSPMRTFENFSANSPKADVPLPEPSSETALYVLSGLVGLALVVLRRRKLA